MLNTNATYCEGIKPYEMMFYVNSSSCQIKFIIKTTEYQTCFFFSGSTVFRKHINYLLTIYYKAYRFSLEYISI